MEIRIVEQCGREAVVTGPVRSFVSVYNSLCASGLQDE